MLIVHNVVTDLLGKRVTVRHLFQHHDWRESRIITGIVRGIASTNDTTFTLLVQQTEIAPHGGTVGSLSAFTVRAEDNTTEIVLEP